MTVNVVVFPGSNCDHDVLHQCERLLGLKTQAVWHRDTSLSNPEIVVIPGGFSYGDYVRAGALAKVSPIMTAVKKFADKGGPVIGICNGFQILCESGLLPGVLLQNVQRKFLSRFVYYQVENVNTPFTRAYAAADIICSPIAHFEGNYFLSDHELEVLEDSGQVVFRYCDKDGQVDHESRDSNPNGSRNSIAGVCNATGNVVGLMPHPERAAEQVVGWLGCSTGCGVLASASSAISELSHQ